ncbi:MAG: heavy metal-binding domain-containing protein [Saprospiraceae bacterium]
MKALFISCLLSFAFLAACQQKKEVNVKVEETGTYACPMKCEGEKVYPVAGKCPVCGMDLEPISGAAASTQYEMRVVSIPEMIEAGKPVKLAFTPGVAGNTTQVPLDEVHEHKIHVIVVSKDLGWYDHIHPEYQADGSYVIEETFPSGGEYIIFSDYNPTGGGNQVSRSTWTVNGVSKKPETFTTQDLSDEVDVYAVVLKPEADKFLTNNLNHMGVEVTEKGKPVTNFETVMGAKGHLVIVSGDGQKYIHVHPDEVEGKLDLHTHFEQQGIYRAFFQFQTNGKLHTSYFTLDVKEGKPGELGTPEGHHSHGEEEGHTHDQGDKDDHKHK